MAKFLIPPINDLMFFLLLGLIAFSFSSFAGAVEYSLGLEGGYLNTRLERSQSSSFTILSKSGNYVRSELSVGSKRFDLFVRPQLNQMNFKAPTSRILFSSEVLAGDYMASLRYKTNFAWLHLGYESKDAVYLTESSQSVYKTGLQNTSLAVAGIKFFGWGSHFKISIEAEIGAPVSAAPAGKAEISIKTVQRGCAKIEFGNAFRFGFSAAVQSFEYQTPDIEYYNTELQIGAVLIFGAGKRNTGNVYFSPPRYPL